MRVWTVEDRLDCHWCIGGIPGRLKATQIGPRLVVRRSRHALQSEEGAERGCRHPCMMMRERLRRGLRSAPVAERSASSTCGCSG